LPTATPLASTWATIPKGTALGNSDLRGPEFLINTPFPTWRLDQ
jgi:hypothetical protein